MSENPFTPLKNHPEIARQVGLVMGEYAVLETFMYVVYATITTKGPDESFAAFYGLRHTHLREELVKSEAEKLDFHVRRALDRLWRRFKGAAKRRAEVAHCGFQGKDGTLYRLRAIGGDAHYEPLTDMIFERTLSQYHTLGNDLLVFAALLSPTMEAVHQLTDTLFLAKLTGKPLERPDHPDPPTPEEEADTLASLARLGLAEWLGAKARGHLLARMNVPRH